MSGAIGPNITGVTVDPAAFKALREKYNAQGDPAAFATAAENGRAAGSNFLGLLKGAVASALGDVRSFSEDTVSAPITKAVVVVPSNLSTIQEVAEPEHSAAMDPSSAVVANHAEVTDTAKTSTVAELASKVDLSALQNVSGHAEADSTDRSWVASTAASKDNSAQVGG